MTPRRRLGKSLLSPGLILVLAHGSLVGQSYEGMPPRFGIPSDEKRIEAWIRDGDVRAMRDHGWRIFSALTSASHSHRPGLKDPLPIWETWYSKEETFSSTDSGSASSFRSIGMNTQQLTFEFPPAQLNPPSPDLPIRIVSVAARVLFNQESHDKIRTNCLYLQSKLDCLAKLPQPSGPNGKPAPREVPPFERESVNLKTAWMRVSHTKCTEIPVWDEEPVSPPNVQNAPIGWNRRVWVYAPGVSRESCGGSDRTSLDAFYHFQVKTQEEIKQWHSSENVRAGRDSEGIAVDDYVALVGFHAATREIPNWIWTTFWWHDRPAEGPFGSDRPSSVFGVWRHYLMDVAFDMDKPRERDASPKVTFNPYLEGALGMGVQSNCMTCHRRAVLPNKPNVVTTYSSDEVQQNQIVVRGSEAATATYLPDFGKRLLLGFVWSLGGLASEPAGAMPAGCGCPQRP